VGAAVSSADLRMLPAVVEIWPPLTGIPVCRSIFPPRADAVDDVSPSYVSGSIDRVRCWLGRGEAGCRHQTPASMLCGFHMYLLTTDRKDSCGQGVRCLARRVRPRAASAVVCAAAHDLATLFARCAGSASPCWWPTDQLPDPCSLRNGTIPPVRRGSNSFYREAD